MAVQIFYRITALLSLALALGLAAGCLAPGRPLIAERSPVLDDAAVRPGQGGVYTVRPGDTLYAIAWRFELDRDGLARANGLRPPYTLRAGQTLRLTTQLPRGSRATRPATPQPSTRPSSKPPARSSTTPPATGRWAWPLALRPSSEFGGRNKGMDFKLRDGAGARVRAAGDGEVVYAGNGIGGYERLIILKHGASLLSAYSFDGTMLVKEQQRVKAGVEIADINNRGRTKQSLHFELRRDGAPIDPRSVLR